MTSIQSFISLDMAVKMFPNLEDLKQRFRAFQKAPLFLCDHLGLKIEGKVLREASRMGFRDFRLMQATGDDQAVVVEFKGHQVRAGREGKCCWR